MSNRNVNLNRESSDQRLPAYARLRDVLSERIGSSEWKADQPIPPESKLAKQYGLSIGTVRKAVDGLVSEGLLERKQGSGTFVRGPSFDASLFRFFQLTKADGARPSIPSSQLLMRVVTTAPKEAKLALNTNDVIKIVRLRKLADEPILFEKIYIPTERFAGFESMSQDEIGPLLYPIYFDTYKVLVKKAIDDLSFATATAEVALRLDISRGDPVATIRRTAFDMDGRAVEWRIAKGSAAKFNYRSEIK
jgi:GntR family transcriptional regulator